MGDDAGASAFAPGVEEVKDDKLDGSIVEEEAKLPDELAASLVAFKKHKAVQQALEEYSEGRYAKEIAAGDDSIPLKFLKDAEYKIPKAASTFAAMMKWRATENVDEAFTYRFECEKIKNVYPHGFSGYDKEGRPVYVERVGLLKAKEVLEIAGDLDNLTKYHILRWEFIHRVLFPEATRIKGSKVETLVTIADLSGLGMQHITPVAVDFLRRMAKIDQEMYPESAHKLYIVNVPWIFQAVWSIIKPLLSARGRNKIEIISGNSSSFLKEHVGEAALPDFLGGTGTFTSSRPETAWRSLCKGTFDTDTYLEGATAASSS